MLSATLVVFCGLAASDFDDMDNPADLEAAIDAGDWPRVLDLALSAWRESRAVELADLIDLAGARIAALAPRRHVPLVEVRT